ncbi:MAG: hypothetical protein MUQ30_19285, partial [Anaerolineae bacterium]|nr:hypothetical protein [Anaerolineae bacterium]
SAGASLVGFADLTGMANLPRGIALAMKHSQEVLADPEDMPNAAYSQEYVDLNAQLTLMAEQIADWLGERDPKATANRATNRHYIPRNSRFRTLYELRGV